MMAEPVKVLTIGGSDSGGAAGIQADLKTFTALGAYGMSALTAVTAQNSVEVRRLLTLPADLVQAQLAAVLDDYGADAVKTGFIGDADLVKVVARGLAGRAAPLVVDSVLVNHRGEAMFGDDVTEAYRRHLLPLATALTPNWREAELLVGGRLASRADGAAAARALGPRCVVITGRREGDRVVDLFWDGNVVTALEGPWLETDNRHGSGDTFSAALAVYLAQGLETKAAVAQTRTFTQRALEKAVGWQLGAGHGPLNHLPGGH